MNKEKIKQELNKINLKDLLEIKEHINALIEYELIGRGVLK